MDKLYHETNGILRDAQMALGRLERASDEREAQIISQEIQKQLNEIEQNCTNLEFYVNKEPPNRRHLVRMKVDQLKNDAQTANMAISTMYSRLTSKWRAKSEREELLTYRFRANDSYSLSIDEHELKMNDSLKNADRGVDDLISQGVAVLENLKFQGMNLKGIKGKMHNIGAALGLSDTTLRMIDRRVREDWMIFCCGCMATLIFMYCFYSWWTR